MIKKLVGWRSNLCFVIEPMWIAMFDKASVNRVNDATTVGAYTIRLWERGFAFEIKVLSFVATIGWCLIDMQSRQSRCRYHCVKWRQIHRRKGIHFTFLLNHQRESSVNIRKGCNIMICDLEDENFKLRPFKSRITLSCRRAIAFDGCNGSTWTRDCVRTRGNWKIWFHFIKENFNLSKVIKNY